MTTLVRITKDTHDVELEIAYATTHNFTGKQLYSHAKTYLHPEALICLEKAIILASKLDLRLKIFDAYRPLEIQEKLWQDNPDPNFISNPETGAVPHCRGVAVDITLIDKHHNELDMGTKFDAFTPLSFHGNTEISTTAQQNRYLLMGIMTTAGWDFYRNEWWHYQLFTPRNYPKLRDSEAQTNML